MYIAKQTHRKQASGLPMGRRKRGGGILGLFLGEEKEVGINSETSGKLQTRLYQPRCLNNWKMLKKKAMGWGGGGTALKT